MIDVMLAGAIRGLVSEGNWVSTLIRDRRPGIVALYISKEGLAAMRLHLSTEDEEAGQAAQVDRC